MSTDPVRFANILWLLVKIALLLILAGGANVVPVYQGF